MSAPTYLTGVARADLAALGHRGGRVGVLPTPASGTASRIPDYPTWAADNGCFAEWINPSRPFDQDRWLAWLASVADRHAPHMARCFFATVPDVVCDWSATLARSLPLIDQVRDLGYPVAVVAQPGATVANYPWPLVDAIFIGGDDPWKDGPVPAQLIAEAHRRGVHAHVGRVNTWRRFAHCADIDADTVDGTGARFGATVVERIASWIARTDPSNTLNLEGAA